MECLLGAAEAARTLELAPSAGRRPKSSEASQRSQRTASALEAPTGTRMPAGTHRAAIMDERKSDIAAMTAYPTSDTEKHAVGQIGDWIRPHSPELGNAALRRVGRASQQPARHNAGQGSPAGRAAMLCARKVLSRNSTTIPGQPSCRKGTRASKSPQAQNLLDFLILPLHGGRQSVGQLASGDVGSSATAADFREFDFAKGAAFGPRRNFEEPPNPSNRISSRPSFGEKQHEPAPRCTLLRIATRPSCAAIAASRTQRAEFNTSRQKEEEQTKMKTTCRGIRRQTTLERACRRGATIPDYSTQQVRRIADIVLGENVSGEEASAILLALIVGPCEPCAFSSDPTEFRHGPSSCGSWAEDALPQANSANSLTLRDMRRPLRRIAARSTGKRNEPDGDIPAIVKTALENQAGTRNLQELPSCSCPTRAPSPQRNLRSARASGHIIPVGNSGSANSVNSRAGHPKCAATYHRHALNRAAMRVLSPGGITLPFRKRRNGRPARNGNPPLVQQTERE